VWHSVVWVFGSVKSWFMALSIRRSKKHLTSSVLLSRYSDAWLHKM